ncbi:MAG: tetratricopeptide repeat protein [Clostridiales bacterium]|nr:tetratricopeptide repeat protein [Clostridiales bacterium]
MPYETFNENGSGDDGRLPIPEINDIENEPDILIQGLSDISEYDSRPDEDLHEDTPVCSRCGAPVSHSAEMCEDCERLIKKYPVAVRSVVFAFIAVFVAVVGTVAFIANRPIASDVYSGDKALRDGKLSDCYQYYESAYSFSSALNSAFKLPSGISLFTSGNGTLSKQFTAIYKLNGPYECGSRIEDFYGDKIPRRLRGIKAEYDMIVKVNSVVDKRFSDYYDSIGDKKNETLEGLVAVIDDIEKEYKFPSYMMNYYRFLSSMAVMADLDVRKGYLDKVMNEKPDALWLYASYGISIYKESGDLNRALYICKELLKLDPTDPSVLAYTVSVLRMSKEYDKAIAFYEKAVKTVDPDIEMIRQYAIILMLQGQYDKAEKMLIDAYEESPEEASEYYLETMCACFIMTENEDDFKRAVDDLSERGRTLPEKITSLRLGETTLEEIFTEGNGETK